MHTIKPNRVDTPITLRSAASLSALLIATVLSGCATSNAGPGEAPAAGAREDIFILRSLREERTPKSTWCTAERAGFAPFNSEFMQDDRFTMWSVQVQARDGRVTDTRAGQAGNLRACFGQTPDPKLVNFYAEGQIGGMSVVGNGECLRVQPDHPEKGITTYRCHLTLRGLPSPYVGGLLTTNSLVSAAILSGDSDPAGYVQTSIATIRLWRSK